MLIIFTLITNNALCINQNCHLLFFYTLKPKHRSGQRVSSLLDRRYVNGIDYKKFRPVNYLLNFLFTAFAVQQYPLYAQFRVGVISHVERHGFRIFHIAIMQSIRKHCNGPLFRQRRMCDVAKKVDVIVCALQWRFERRCSEMSKRVHHRRHRARERVHVNVNRVLWNTSFHCCVVVHLPLSCVLYILFDNQFDL